MTSSRAFDPVASYLDALTHPRKDEVLALCALIGATCPHLIGSIKWNAPSFGQPGQDDCLTLRLHPAPALQLVLHRGAKPAATPPPHPPAPFGLVVWKAPDRGVVDFAKRPLGAVAGDLADLIRAWVAG